MEKVQGIGGVFFRSADPEKLARWYQDHLGVDAVSDGDVWRPAGGPVVFAPFAADTGYFGRPGQQWMLNYRVRDLDAMLAQLRQAGADVDDEVRTQEGIGRFGWACDPEGNRFELWEPVPEAL
ncbi:VOC family protein [Streptomyces sp. NPDC051940]|uniref:VOC family protein n=1 Tax=Streptomyces sp. NPDC051940 TaxID=3155675 RepID=UPI00341AE03C